MKKVSDGGKHFRQKQNEGGGGGAPRKSEGIEPVIRDDWFESLQDLLATYGPEKVSELLAEVNRTAASAGAAPAQPVTTPYINTIPASEEPEYPGDLALERRLRSIIRWNAMAMVVRANKEHEGIGGHISSFASQATLMDVGFNHFFRGKTDGNAGDFLYIQGHSSPGIYARAFLEGRLNEDDLVKFRREAPRENGLSSYPHPWLMPGFWQFPTVSMGLGPIMALYHARFLKYLQNRGLKDTSGTQIWCYIGDGELDEPETLGALTLASRESLDNLTFVVNCNLQRLDGPVRGNGKIIQEMEGVFRGSGWNVIKLIWGSDWDPLLEADTSGRLVERMSEVVDGQYQKYIVESGEYIRKDFFGADPQLAKLVEGMSDEQLWKLSRGGHDPKKVYAAYKAATESGGPTVVLAKTVKGYGLGEAGEGRNITHQQKKLNEDELAAFRERFDIPIKPEQVAKSPFYKPDDDSEEIRYLKKRREDLGGYLPKRSYEFEKLTIPSLEDWSNLLEGSGGREVSTTMAFGRLLGQLLKNKKIGPRVVPIIPDEARTFGLETLFRKIGIYSAKGQLYEPVDADQFLYYKEAKDGQILEEGISEAGSMSSFIAAGTSYCNLDITTIPFFIYYSMFGFQRIGDLIWAAADSRVKGFMLGGTAGRTTLNGEGLQHEDGHSHLAASTVPNLLPYDPAYAYEVAVIIQEGMRRMYVEDESVFYYLTLYNENYDMPPMPEGSREGILKGLYPLSSRDGGTSAPRVQLFGSGSILPEVARAQKLLAEEFSVGSDLWSATSYTLLRRDALATERWNRLHPSKKQKVSYLENVLQNKEGPFVAVSDYMKALPDQIARWVPGTFVPLGTDGFGRSDTREALRNHFEISAEHTVYSALWALYKDGKIEKRTLTHAIKKLELDPDKIDPANA